uniref:Uncharacterized protein n=1 Tax=Panagrolaimus sp. ES5 TaxID=591445 RepID=A0AC34FL37_9BILA
MATRRAPPRAYVTSAYQIDFHIEENKAADSLDEVIQFLISAGKIRQSVADKLKTSSDQSSSSSAQVFPNKDKLITIGLRQNLKAYNEKKLKWILLDSSTVTPSAVGQVMGLMATNGTKETNFFVIPELSPTISKALNLPKISAIGFGSDCGSELDVVFMNLHPIDIALKKKAEEAQKPSSSSTKSTFILPQLEVPKGKSKLSKKQKKKIAGKKK